MNKNFVVKLLSAVALTTLIVSVGGGTTVLAEGGCPNHGNDYEYALPIGAHDPDKHKIICNECGTKIREESHSNSGDYYRGDPNGHAFECSVCHDYIGDLESHTYGDWIDFSDRGQHAKACEVCGLIDDNSWGDHDTDGNNGCCSQCGHGAEPVCPPSEPCTPVEEDKKEEKKESSSSSSSSSKQTYSAPVTAETIRAAEGVTGSKEFVAKQTTMTTTVNNTIAALNNLAAINPAQANVLKNIGISLNAGGCTSFNATTTATLVKNNTVPYNLAFTWKNISFRVVIPKGANLSELVDPVTGQLYFYKLVQKYGVAGCTLIK